MDAELLRRIDRLESLDEIRQLPAKYALSLDMRDLDAHVNLFAHDIRVSRDKVGRSHLKRWLDDTLRKQFTGTSHHIGNHIIEFDDADHAHGVVYSKNEHETGNEWVIMQMLYWDNYERIDGRWYFRRRLPCYWYATDLNAPPVGDNKMRWPDREPYEGAYHELWPSWQEFWSKPPDSDSPEVAAPAPLDQFLTAMRSNAAEPKNTYKVKRIMTANNKQPRTNIFSAVSLGSLALANRIVMAPMTRSRAGAGAAPTQMMADYYAQRASAGLIISEGIAPSANGLGYSRTPGLYNDTQVDGWSRVTAAVHAAGGKIVAQLMHVGRVANKLNKPAGSETLGPSPVQARGEIYTEEAGMQPFDSPRELRADEIGAVIDEYRLATVNAFRAGFDGVELHCTSGYLPAQFLSTGTNQRTDAYGGSVQNRCRFPLEVLAAMASVGGHGRVGMRICPDNPFNDLADEDPLDTFEYFLGEAALLDLAYLHVIRMPSGSVDNIALGQRFFGDRLIVNDSYDFREANEFIANGSAAAVSFGRPYIANPDLVERFREGAALAKFDARTLYAGGEHGYSDYPFYTPGKVVTQ